MLIAILLLALSGILFFATRRETPFMVIGGDLSAKDLTEIKRTVHRELRREAFPDLSWDSVKRLPGGLRFLAGVNIRAVEIRYSDSSYVRVWIGRSRDPEESLRLTIPLERGTNGWMVIR